MAILDRVPNVPDIYARINELLPRFPRMSQTVRGRFLPYWEDAPLNLAEHIEITSSDGYRTEAALHRAVEERFSKGLDRNKPLWVLSIFAPATESIAETPSRAAALFMVHHAFADGLGGLALFHAICGQNVKSRELVEKTIENEEEKNSGASGIQPLRRVRSSIRLIREGLTPRGKSPLQGKNSAQRALRVWEIPLSELRSVKRKHRVTLYECMLAIIGRGIRRFHQRTAGPLSTLRVLVPVNLRERAEWFNLGNYLSGISLPLPLKLENAHDFLRAIKRKMDTYKHRGSFGAFKILASFNSVMPLFLRRLLCEFAAKKINFICTPVFGPRSPLSLGGAEILEEYALPALMREHGVAFGVMRYRNSMFVSCISDPQILTEPEQLKADCLRAAQELMSP